MSEYLATDLPCSDCEGSHGLAVYADYSTYCHKCCSVHSPPEDSTQLESLVATQYSTNNQRKGNRFMPKSTEEFTYADQASFMDIRQRGISKETCELYGVKSMESKKGKPVCMFPQTNEKGDQISQKIRDHRKDKKERGHMLIETLDGHSFSEALPFGWSCFSHTQYRYYTIFEGEYDAMAGYELLGRQGPCYSVNTGAGSAKRDVNKVFDKLNVAGKEVILCFDMDEEGQKAAKKIQKLFTKAKCKIMELPIGFKDANDVLLASKDNPQLIKDFTRCWWNSEEWMPEGFVNGQKAFEMSLVEDNSECIVTPWAGFDELTCGIRTSELWTFTAGSGQGKSAIIRELIMHLYNTTDWNIGVMMLEENVTKTLRALTGLQCSQPLQIDCVRGTDEEKAKAKKKYEEEAEPIFNQDSDRWEVLNTFGSGEIDKIVEGVSWLARNKDCKAIFLDHISIVVSAQENGDERKANDEVMTKLATLAHDEGIFLCVVSHLKRPSGKGHEEGAATSLSELRGSASIAQLSDMVIGLERDQQAKHNELKNTTLIRVLKNRFTGETGEACYLHYNKQSGRLKEVDSDTVQDWIKEDSGEDSDEEYVSKKPVNRFGDT